MSKLLKDENSIKAWLDMHNVANYTLIEDSEHGFVVDVDGSVDLKYRDLFIIPVKFNTISEYFDCGHNKLENLNGAPMLVKGYFGCNNNHLISLKGCPASVGENFYCNNNQLTSLEGGPISIGWSFWCDNNQLTSLEGAPTTVGGNFYCYNNQLKTLDFFPTSVGGEFHCDNNPQLDKYQYITDFIELKDKLTSDREKASLSASLALPVKSILHKV